MRHLFIVLALVLLAGCATPYERSGFNGGYSDTQLSVNMFKVYFEGNSNTSAERASDFLLLRSAELTLREGYKYFTVADKKEEMREGSFTTPLRVRTTKDSNLSGDVIKLDEEGRVINYDVTKTNETVVKVTGGETYYYKEPYYSQTIKCYKNKPSNGFVYDASFLNKSLRAKHELE